eukprot:scpid29484/ scgid9123/ 
MSVNDIDSRALVEETPPEGDLENDPSLSPPLTPQLRGGHTPSVTGKLQHNVDESVPKKLTLQRCSINLLSDQETWLKGEGANSTGPSREATDIHFDPAISDSDLPLSPLSNCSEQGFIAGQDDATRIESRENEYDQSPESLREITQGTRISKPVYPCSTPSPIFNDEPLLQTQSEDSALDGNSLSVTHSPRLGVLPTLSPPKPETKSAHPDSVTENTCRELQIVQSGLAGYAGETGDFVSTQSEESSDCGDCHNEATTNILESSNVTSPGNCDFAENKEDNRIGTHEPSSVNEIRSTQTVDAGVKFMFCVPEEEHLSQELSVDADCTALQHGATSAGNSCSSECTSNMPGTNSVYADANSYDSQKWDPSDTGDKQQDSTLTPEWPTNGSDEDEEEEEEENQEIANRSLSPCHPGNATNFGPSAASSDASSDDTLSCSVVTSSPICAGQKVPSPNDIAELQDHLSCSERSVDDTSDAVSLNSLSGSDCPSTCPTVILTGASAMHVDTRLAEVPCPGSPVQHSQSISAQEEQEHCHHDQPAVMSSQCLPEQVTLVSALAPIPVSAAEVATTQGLRNLQDTAPAECRTYRDDIEAPQPVLLGVGLSSPITTFQPSSDAEMDDMTSRRAGIDPGCTIVNDHIRHSPVDVAESSSHSSSSCGFAARKRSTTPIDPDTYEYHTSNMDMLFSMRHSDSTTEVCNAQDTLVPSTSEQPAIARCQQTNARMLQVAPAVQGEAHDQDIHSNLEVVNSGMALADAEAASSGESSAPVHDSSFYASTPDYQRSSDQSISAHAGDVVIPGQMHESKCDTIPAKPSHEQHMCRPAMVQSPGDISVLEVELEGVDETEDIAITLPCATGTFIDDGLCDDDSLTPSGTDSGIILSVPNHPTQLLSNSSPPAVQYIQASKGAECKPRWFLVNKPTAHPRRRTGLSKRAKCQPLHKNTT